MNESIIIIQNKKKKNRECIIYLTSIKSSCKRNNHADVKKQLHLNLTKKLNKKINNTADYVSDFMSENTSQPATNLVLSLLS